MPPNPSKSIGTAKPSDPAVQSALKAQPEKALLAPLFMVALAAVAFEVALIRFFAVGSWAEYGYWVISITMVGLGASGVVLSLFAETFRRHRAGIFAASPLLLMLFAGFGYWAVVAVPFNPLELQNHATMGAQLLNIGKYYIALLPFFFWVGLYIGLYFVSYGDEIPRIYGADLAGAGVGGILTLVLMYVVEPFSLLAALLPTLLIATWATPMAKGWKVASVAVFAATEVFLLTAVSPGYNEFKAISAPMKVQGNKLLEQTVSARGLYVVLDNYTERTDVDLSNNAQVQGDSQPIGTYGLYSDGNRLTSLPKAGDKIPDVAYVKSALDSFPYQQMPNARVLLLGSRGGLRIAEALALGAREVVALETDPVIYEAVVKYNAWLGGRKNVTLLKEGFATYLARDRQPFDIVDIAADFQGQNEVNKFAFTVEAIRMYLNALSPNGVVVLPNTIREMTVYANKLFTTIRAAVGGADAAAKQVTVYRSAWNARFLVAKSPLQPATVAALEKFCDERSFDISFAAGLDLAKRQIWNDLPTVSFENETSSASAGAAAADALASELKGLQQEVSQKDAPAKQFFDLSPATFDKPFFYSVLRATEVVKVIEKIQLAPREEIGFIVNLAVLAQAALFALLVLAIPLFRPSARKASSGTPVKAILYFAGLGLGFLFLEIFWIEKSVFLLQDRTVGFSLVLATMLFFSGGGSYYSGKYDARGPLAQRTALRWAVLGVFAWVGLIAFGWERLSLQILDWPLFAKCAFVTLVTAPLGFCLGFPFSAGLTALRGEHSFFLPWAWGLNGAFSVVATPLANLIAISLGYTWLAIASIGLYAMVALAWPGRIKH